MLRGSVNKKGFYAFHWAKIKKMVEKKLEGTKGARNYSVSFLEI